VWWLLDWFVRWNQGAPRGEIESVDPLMFCRRRYFFYPILSGFLISKVAQILSSHLDRSICSDLEQDWPEL
jgi:hypothetical protein